MQVTHGSLKPLLGPETGALAVTIGNFDGVHRGHRAMLERLVTQSRKLGLSSCALTFEPHPREYFAAANPLAGSIPAPARLTRLRDKLELMAGTGVERVHVLRFGRALASLTAERFIEEVLVRGLRTRWLLVGEDFRFGAGRAGDFALLSQSGPRLGFEVQAMPEVLEGRERVSSSAVRTALAAGRLDEAARLLGRNYEISGRVSHGAKLGRTLGFPTANIVLRRRPPLAGIFAVEAELAETAQVLAGAASVGRRPTVSADAPPLLEVFLLDFRGEIYGKHLRVRFLRKLREEAKFEGLEALRDAIGRDVQQAREFFQSNG